MLRIRNLGLFASGAAFAAPDVCFNSHPSFPEQISASRRV